MLVVQVPRGDERVSVIYSFSGKWFDICLQIKKIFLKRQDQRAASPHSIKIFKSIGLLLNQLAGPGWWSNKTRLFYIYLNWDLSCFSARKINHNLGSLFCLLKDAAAVFCVCVCVCILHWCLVNHDPRQPPGYELMCYCTKPYLKTFC